eukprot:scaffold1509_cov240-Pinguiococcus_pyrenoidosus.AAC.45
MNEAKIRSERQLDQDPQGRKASETWFLFSRRPAPNLAPYPVPGGAQASARLLYVHVVGVHEWKQKPLREGGTMHGDIWYYISLYCFTLFFRKTRYLTMPTAFPVENH